MNILFLSEPDPRMTHFGGAQRTNFIWRALQEVGEVYTLTFDQRFATEEVAPRLWYVKKLQKVNPIRDFFYKAQLRLFKPLHVLNCWPLSTKLEKSVDDIFPGIQFDVVVCRYLDVLGEMHMWGYPRLIVDIDDDPIQMFETSRRKEVVPWLRPLARWVLKKQVSFLSSKISMGWVSNRVLSSNELGTSSIMPLPNIASCPAASYNVEAERRPLIISVGAMDYKPNFEGVDRFLKDIWPAVHAKYPDLEYGIIGKNAPKEYQERWTKIPNVIQMGFVDNLEKVYEECLCSVVSIFEGGGTCIKTLESLSYSRVCLATPFGARGHESAMGNGNIGLFSYTSSEDFLKLLEYEVMNESHRSRNEQLGKVYIENKYSYYTVVDIIRNSIQGIL